MSIRNLVISFLLLACVCAQAKPARPGLVRHIQPDGSTLLIRLMGDEQGHYALDAQGRVLELDAQGFYRLSPTPEAALRRRLAPRRQNPSPRTVPSRLHVAVVLVEFQDMGFSLSSPQRHFQQLLSQAGYAEDGGTGSVRDYYLDNSNGRFSLSFEVFGPVKLPERRAHYGADNAAGEDQAAETAFLEACRLVDAVVDFSRFDADGDGLVDQLIFFYAGYDQAEGGPSEAFWSHHGHLQESGGASVRNARLDGVGLGDYVCTAELQGAEGVRPMGIGSTCHELGHSLGLPDFYDVDGGRDGQAGGLYQFSLMSIGLYNDEGRTPPHLNALERELLGWLAPEDILPLPKEGSFRIGPVQEDVAYRSETGTEGEYFVYECRNGHGWDTPLPQGLVIYHIDQSQRVVGNFPAASLWEEWRVYNNLNSQGKHPCFYLVPAVETSSLYYAGALTMPGNLVFPGNGRVHAFVPVDWEDREDGVQLVCLSYEDGAARARVVRREDRYLCGEIRDVQGRPVTNVTLTVEGEPPALSNLEGFYLLPVSDKTPDSFTVTATKGGYRPVTTETGLLEGQRVGCLPLTMLEADVPASQSLSKWDRTQPYGYYPTAEPAVGAVRLTPADLAAYAHHRLEKIICYPYLGTSAPGQLYVTVDIDGERVLTRAVPGKSFPSYEPVTVDVSDADIRIPEGRDIYVGYGFDGGTPLGVVYPGTQGSSYWKPFAQPGAPWQEVYSTRSGYFMDVLVDAVATEVPAETLDGMGYAYIDPGSGTPLAGEAFILRVHLPAGETPAVRWTYDGEAVAEGTVTLAKGTHVLQAHLSYPDGRTETLQMDFDI